MSRLIASSDVTFALGYTPVNQTALANYALTSSLATVATTGSYGDLLNRPTPYSLPLASGATVGGVKVGTGLAVATDGTLSVTGTASGGTSSYQLPVASASTLGGVKQGVNVTIASDGTISAAGSSAVAYSLPIAASGTLGGVKIGSGLAVATDGTLTTTGTGGTTYTLPIGSSSALGGYKVGAGLAVATDGTLSASAVTSAAISTALGFTPYSATNPSGYQTAAQVTAALPVAATVAPLPHGTAAVGTSLLYARQDHVHPISTSSYVLPIGSATVLGGYKVGTGLAVATDGTLSATGTATSTYTLSPATSAVLGGVKVGANLAVATDGTLSAAAPVGPATVAPLVDGTAAVGTSALYARQDHVHGTDTSRYAASNPSGFQTAAQVSASITASAYSLGIASATALGGIKVGNGLAVATDGTLSTTGSGGTAYTLNPATSAVLGGIKVGSNLTVATDGTLSAAAPVSPATVAPLVDGTAAVGTSVLYARQDHVHGTDTSRYAASNPSAFQTAAQVTTAITSAVKVRNAPRIITGTGNVTAATADYYIGYNRTTSAASTLTFEANPVADTTHVVKDIKGDADTNPITVVAGLVGTVAGTIDGQANFVHNYPGSSFTFYHNGLEWSII